MATVGEMVRRAAGMRLGRREGKIAAKLIRAAARRDLTPHEFAQLALILQIRPTELQSIAREDA